MFSKVKAKEIPMGILRISIAIILKEAIAQMCFVTKVLRERN